MLWRVRVRDRPGVRERASAAGRRTNAHALYARTNCRARHPETSVELSLFDSFGEFICSKRSCSIRYRVEWCINNCLQSTQFVGMPVEEEKEKEDGENRGLTDFRV